MEFNDLPRLLRELLPQDQPTFVRRPSPLLKFHLIFLVIFHHLPLLCPFPATAFYPNGRPSTFSAQVSESRWNPILVKNGRRFSLFFSFLFLYSLSRLRDTPWVFSHNRSDFSDLCLFLSEFAWAIPTFFPPLRASSVQMKVEDSQPFLEGLRTVQLFLPSFLNRSVY